MCLVLVLLQACRQQQQQPALFELMDQTGINFSNDIRNTKDFNIFSYRNFYNGGGAAIGDINNDGLADIFFTANMAGNKLYLNKGNWKFDDISASAGFAQADNWSTGVVMADINNDGWLDIYVCNAGYQNGRVPQNQLFINNRNLTFTDSAEAYGLTNNGGYCTHAAFFDYDRDGDLDCFIVNNSFIPVNTLNYANKRNLRAKDWPVADFLKGGGDKLLRNDNGRYIDISQQAGIHGSLISFGLGVTVGDVNGDNYPDIYVSNDFFERDYLYINQKNGNFKDELENWVQHSSLSSMGADMGDVNNDGHPDIFVTDMLPAEDYRLKTTTSFDNIDVYKLKEASGFHHQFTQNSLQLNNGNGKFCEIAFYSGVARSDWSWGGLMFDADNDGLSDLYVCNGIFHDVIDQDFIDFFGNDVVQRMVFTGRKEQVDEIIAKMPSNPIPNKMFRNTGNLKFADAGADWGLAAPSFSNGAAYGDLDNDGDLDLVVNNVNQKAFVYRNNASLRQNNHYIGFKLKGSDKNTFAVGSLVKVFSGREVLTRELIPTRGFQSSIDYKIIIGLGNRPVDSAVLQWPNGAVSVLVKPAVDSVHALQQPAAGTQPHAPALQPFDPLLKPETAAFDKHIENNYIDFYQERNVPKMLSAEGPCSAVGDVNGDGLDDVFIGGAAGQSGQLYLQSPQGFVKKPTVSFDRFAVFEDVAAVFFDCDNDKDLDLFVGAGGNHVPRGSQELQHRLYFNDGKGNFEIGAINFPNNYSNTGVAVAHDFDGDGDQDLFVGGRSVPFQYGLTPLSHVYLNDGKGQFTEMNKDALGGLAEAGMVTDAVWANVDGDAKKELVVVGEWMQPRIFSFNGQRFTEIKTSLADKFGWWQSVTAMDIDGDNDLDLVLGNLGENFYLAPDSARPVKIYINDFDGNSTADVVITQTLNGKDVPVFLKRELTEQMPSLKKQALKHHDYAGKSISDLVKPAQLNGALVKTFNYASSCLAVNLGNGRFEIRKLPPGVQLSSVNAILPVDVNRDGRMDLVMGGNEIGFLPQFSRIDASYGNVLINQGSGSFTELPPARSGLEVTGVVRDMKIVAGKGKNYVLILRNNESPILYSVK